MIEALAMLGLISMVTPVIYKKAAERTTEMQDINAASQVRVIVKAIDDYLRDNYTTITAGGEVTSQAAPEDAKTVDYSKYNFGSNGTETKTTEPLNIEHFRDYLPLGFRPDGKLFKEFDVVIKQTRDPSGERKALTTVLVAKTNKDGSVDPAFTRLRSSRIASMIGTNGGFVDGDKATGVQGVWEIPKTELPNSDVKDGTIVATSLEAVADGTGGGKNVLHRVATPGRPEYNTMETALNMGGNDVNHLVNLIAAADNQIHIKAQTGSDNVLLHVDGKSTVDSTLKAAGENFIAESNYMRHKKKLYVGENLEFLVDGADGSVSSANGNHVIDGEGNTAQSGFAKIDKYAEVGGYLSALDDLFRVDHNGPAGPQMVLHNNTNFILSANDGNVNFMNGKVGIDTSGNTKIDGKISAKGDVHIGNDVSTSGNSYSSGGKINMFADSGDLDMTGTFSAAYNENAYGDNTEKGTHNMKLSKTQFKAGASTSLSYPGYNLDVGNSTSNSVKLAATSKTYREGGTAATKYPAWKDHNLTVNASTTYNEGTLYSGKRTNATDPYTNNYQNWSNYNLKLTDTDMKLESGASFQRLENGQYNLKFGRYGDEGYKPYVMAGYNPDQKGSRKYLFEINGATHGVRLGDGGGASLNVYNRYNADWLGYRSGIGFQVGGDNVGSAIFQVATDASDEDRATLYFNRGYLTLETNTDSTTDHRRPSGYIRADRLLSSHAGNGNRTNRNYAGTGDGTGIKDVGSGNGVYDEYQVNPAYTSMMHDIKLATRGGARLSDILPDFINKGIYVMDNTYYGNVNWESATVSGGNGNYSISETGKSFGSCNSTKCDTSAWMGFIPTPNCPPGYMQVATITPIRFAMAQAGVPIQVSGNGGIEGNPYSNEHYRVLGTRKDPRGDKVTVNGRTTGDTLVHVYENGAGQNIEVDGAKVSTPAPEYWADVYNTPYTFQVSTWLNTTLKAYKPSSGFKGWHGIMGFIYPAKDYEDYLKAIGAKTAAATISDTEIIWNLFPVYKEELSAIATVYCYFNRTAFNSTYVDQYLPHGVDINNIRYQTKQNISGGSRTDTDYMKHLNDETLKYKTVW